jgi:hypothetical protein
VEQWHAHHQVVVEEFRRMIAIRSNPTDASRKMDDDVGPDVVEKASDVLDDPQVVLLPPGCQNVCSPALLERLHDIRTKKPRPPYDEDPLLLPKVPTIGP